MFGADEPGHVDPEPSPHANEHVARRAAERAERQARREPAAFDLENGSTRMARDVREAFTPDAATIEARLQPTGYGIDPDDGSSTTERAEARRTETDGIVTWDAETGALL